MATEAHVPPLVVSGSETILLVEDEDAVRAIAARGLEMLGYKVLQANGGKEAITICKTYPGTIDLLISDVIMPEMGGAEVARAAQAIRRDLKVLYVSGYTDDTITRQGILEEESAFLQKPFTPTSLARKVREVLAGGQTAAEV
jgi:CheY-like chemotaxis protein